jgi:hypothetical protein
MPEIVWLNENIEDLLPEFSQALFERRQIG